MRSLMFLFPVLHGQFGEDGTIQGLLEMANVPYVGGGVLASSTVDNGGNEVAVLQAGLRSSLHLVSPQALARRSAGHQRKVSRELGCPCFVKPANLGSSLGISGD